MKITISATPVRFNHGGGYTMVLSFSVTDRLFSADYEVKNAAELERLLPTVREKIHEQAMISIRVGRGERKFNGFDKWEKANRALLECREGDSRVAA